MLNATNFWPTANSTTHMLLADLLNGEQVTVIDALMNYNLMTPNARVSELRSAGWPINSIKVPHPRLNGQQIVAYSMDAHFRNWWITEAGQGKLKTPSQYPFKAGRGKFSKQEIINA